MPGHLTTAHVSDSCLMLDYVRVTNFRRVVVVIIIIIIINHLHVTMQVSV